MVSSGVRWRDSKSVEEVDWSAVVEGEECDVSGVGG
jgi:hypothetical protein